MWLEQEGLWGRVWGFVLGDQGLLFRGLDSRLRIFRFLFFFFSLSYLLAKNHLKVD